jgi:hypothetical protein
MTYFKVSAIGTLPLSDIFVTSFHVLSTAALSTVHAAVNTEWSTFWSAIGAHMPIATVLKEVKTVELNGTNGKQTFALTTAHNTPGTGVAPDISQQCAVLISLRTASAAKGGHGRQYLPAPVSGSTTGNGQLSPAAQTVIDNAYGTMVTNLGSTYQVVVLHGGFHRKPDGTPEYLPLTHDVVTSTRVRDVLATQRRRTNRILVNYTSFAIA